MPQTRGASKMDTEGLIKKVCNTLFIQLQSKLDEMDSKLLRMEKKINEKNEKLNKLDKLEEMNNQLVSFAQSFNYLNTSVEQNKKSIEEVNKKLDLSSQYAKRNSLRFYGFDENDDDIVQVVVDFISNILKVPCTIQDIDCAFRIGKSVKNDGKPRSVLVNFVNNWKRSQDLTKGRYEALLAAKEKYGRDKAWSAGGKIFVLHDGRKCLYNFGESA
ncbi:hypothetical protein NQ314_014120 [Rhamnusium bicolor]|uniref:Uncharacterized protein n=1 Tax=Rhamnusium bicolor TaxID=1586634 RepID=A0AAV8X445_9CUCU|nr:hypothetical protein NQ314_014120 [Rhamnusium bicolor]